MTRPVDELRCTNAELYWLCCALAGKDLLSDWNSGGGSRRLGGGVSSGKLVISSGRGL